MALLSLHSTRLRLPARIRSKPEIADSMGSRLALAERIADLRGIETIEYGDGALPREVHFCLHGRPLCSIAPEGINVYGLDDRNRNQVLSSGWGRLVEDRVFLNLPRDAQELDVCWRIICEAYDSLASKAGKLAQRFGAPPALPAFSRTNLQ